MGDDRWAKYFAACNIISNASTTDKDYTALLQRYGSLS